MAVKDPGLRAVDQQAVGVPHSPAADDPAALTFPDLPRLELDQLLGQLVDRANEVMGAQGRLRGLLHANQMIVGPLALPIVLRRIAEAARELIGARFAALGVIAPDGHLSEFIHVGMGEVTVEKIGRLPQGKGLLGALIEEPQPIRLTRIPDDARSSGFPRHHPPMTTFLGVPIRVRNEVFGNLYLTESTKGEFTDDDEALATSLAATAGVAIDNARLFEAARTRQEWLQATAAITRQLLSGDLSDPLHLIAERTRQIARADVVTVVRPTEPEGGELRVEVAVGARSEQLVGMRLPIEGSVSGRVFSTGEPLRISGRRDQAGVALAMAAELELGAVLVVPLGGSMRMHGVLTVARLCGRPAFTAEDLEMASGFANQAAVAVELADARTERERTAMLDERERIAGDLHDHVIQSLFAAGLTLQSVAGRLEPGPSTDRILSTINGLDDTIRQIRTSIFQLGQQSGAPGLRSRVLDVVADVTPALGFEPSVRFSGPIEDVPGGELSDDMVAVLHEALSNVARHAGASAVSADIIAAVDRLTVDVRDNGHGLGETTRRSGLANIRRRAERHEGSMDLMPVEPSGTKIRWSVPISR